MFTNSQSCLNCLFLVMAENPKSGTYSSVFLLNKVVNAAHVYSLNPIG